MPDKDATQQENPTSADRSSHAVESGSRARHEDHSPSEDKTRSGKTTEDLVREQGADSKNEPES